MGEGILSARIEWELAFSLRVFIYTAFGIVHSLAMMRNAIYGVLSLIMLMFSVCLCCCLKFRGFLGNWLGEVLKYYKRSLSSTPSELVRTDQRQPD